MRSKIHRRQHLVGISNRIGCGCLDGSQTYDRNALCVGSMSVAGESADDRQQHATAQEAHHTVDLRLQKHYDKEVIENMKM